MAAPVVERIRVIDAHVSEPEDLWTSRVSSRWGDLVPHVAKSPRRRAEHHARKWPEELLRKVLHDNAARLYSLE